MCGNVLLIQDFGNVAVEIRKATWPGGEKPLIGQLQIPVSLNRERTVGLAHALILQASQLKGEVTVVQFTCLQ